MQTVFHFLSQGCRLGAYVIIVTLHGTGVRIVYLFEGMISLCTTRQRLVHLFIIPVVDFHHCWCNHIYPVIERYDWYFADKVGETDG